MCSVCHSSMEETVESLPGACTSSNPLAPCVFPPRSVLPPHTHALQPGLVTG